MSGLYLMYTGFSTPKHQCPIIGSQHPEHHTVHSHTPNAFSYSPHWFPFHVDLKRCQVFSLMRNILRKQLHLRRATAGEMILVPSFELACYLKKMKQCFLKLALFNLQICYPQMNANILSIKYSTREVSLWYLFVWPYSPVASHLN